MSYKKYFKQTLHAKFGDDRRQVKKKLWPKKLIFLSLRVNFLHKKKLTLRQKYPGTTGNWHNWEMMCTVYM